jgi:fructose-bisphosphate aldolase / 6-deoxy-5-ketofructose 1-phosphate synthase
MPMAELFIPADVPVSMHKEYSKNYHALTHGTERVLLFAADHKIEHLDKDFYGPHIDPSAHNPEHIFKIASEGRIGALATQLGLIARYGKQYPAVHFIAKLNSKTNIIPIAHKDPLSKQLWNVEDVISLKKQMGLSICGIGLTVYLGSEYEGIMLSQAAQAVFEAHQHGLITILWMYPRGSNVLDDKSGDIIAGAAGVAPCLGSDFAKINPPHPTEKHSSIELLKRAVEAAGNTKIICAGGEAHSPQVLFQEIYDQLTIGGTAGAGIGRNIYQHSLKEAVAMTRALAALIYDKASVQDALQYLSTK